MLNLGQVRLLAAEVDENYPADVRMIRIIRERTEHHLDRRPLLTTAAFVVRDRDYAVDVRILLPIVQSELSHHGNLLRFMAGAHAGRHDQHIVSCTHAPIGPAKSEKGCALIFGDVNGRRYVEILRQIANDRNIVRHVIVRNHLAFTNAERGSNRLAKLQNELAARNRSGGEAMAGRDWRFN